MRVVFASTVVSKWRGRALLDLINECLLKLGESLKTQARHEPDNRGPADLGPICQPCHRHQPGGRVCSQYRVGDAAFRLGQLREGGSNPLSNQGHETNVTQFHLTGKTVRGLDALAHLSKNLVPSLSRGKGPVEGICRDQRGYRTSCLE